MNKSAGFSVYSLSMRSLLESNFGTSNGTGKDEEEYFEKSQKGKDFCDAFFRYVGKSPIVCGHFQNARESNF
jgi:hypothetical protein